MKPTVGIYWLEFYSNINLMEAKINNDSTILVKVNGVAR